MTMKTSTIIVVVALLSALGCARYQVGDPVAGCTTAPAPSAVTIVAKNLNFEELKSVYLRETSGAVRAVSWSAIKDVEAALAKLKGAALDERAVLATNVFYDAQVRKVVERCVAPAFDELAAARLVESGYARTIASAGLRGTAANVVDPLLPPVVSPNLTARVSVVGLSLGCDLDSTPNLANLLKELGLPCGRTDIRSR